MCHGSTVLDKQTQGPEFNPQHPDTAKQTKLGKNYTVRVKQSFVFSPL